MKKKKELNVDIIGEQGPLTIEEEKMISEFLKSRSIKKRQTIPRKKVSKRIQAA